MKVLPAFAAAPSRIAHDISASLAPASAMRISPLILDFARYTCSHARLRESSVPRWLIQRKHRMKYIVAIIPPCKFDAVRDALSEQGIAGIVVSEVQSSGREVRKKDQIKGLDDSGLGMNACLEFTQ